MYVRGQTPVAEATDDSGKTSFSKTQRLARELLSRPDAEGAKLPAVVNVFGTRGDGGMYRRAGAEVS